MTTFIVILLICVAALLAWVVKLLLATPADGKGGAYNPADYLPADRRSSSREVTDMADRMLGRIDDRIEMLRDLIAEADQRIETMQRRDGYVLPAESPFGEKENRGPGKKGAEAPPPGSKRAKIVALRRKGLPTDAIAREVNMGLGEVELILKIEGYD